MPRNAAGVYALPTPPVVPDTTIDAPDENVTRSDLATELTNSLDRNGRGGMLAPFRISDGTRPAPGLGFTLEINSGLYRAGTNDIRMSVGATDVMKWTPLGVALLASLIGNVVTSGDITAEGGTVTSGTDARAGVSSVKINAAAGQQKALNFQSGGLDRWIMRSTTTAEGGGNAGSDFQFLSRDDTGAALSTILSVTRSTGVSVWGGSVHIPAPSELLVGTTVSGSGVTRIYDVDGAPLELSGVSENNDADKIANILMSRYTNAHTPFTGLRLASTLTQNIVQIGGGAGSFAPATEIQFRTDALSSAGGTGSTRLSVLTDGSIVAANRVLQSRGTNVASAATITLGAGGNYFRITGNTNINLIETTGWQGGSVVRLMFVGNLTVAHNAAAAGTAHPLFLAGSANFAATANDTLTLVYDDSSARWNELSRTVI